jgi:DNA-binding NtrC family response regulator
MSTAPATVLLVEDEAALRQVLQRALERQGYRVLAAGSAETAYELLGTERADAVLLDVQLPVMSGLALYLAIVHRAPTLAGRIAIMTGDAEAESVRAWRERNPCTVLHKPFDLHQILDWVRSVVAASGERREKG